MGCGTAANRQELRYHAALIVEAGLTLPLLAAGVRLREMPGLPPGMRSGNTAAWYEPSLARKREPRDSTSWLLLAPRYRGSFV